MYGIVLEHPIEREGLFIEVLGPFEDINDAKIWCNENQIGGTIMTMATVER